MPKFIVNFPIKYKGSLRHFTAEVDLPEAPRKGEIIWLHVDNERRRYPFRVVRRLEMLEGEALEYDCKPCLLHRKAIRISLSPGTRWMEFYYDARRKKFPKLSWFLPELQD